MAYSDIGIINVGLGRIGQPKISSLSEDSTAAIQASVALEYVRDELLEAADWVFAKTRLVLSKNATVPVQGYDFAYTLPPDFLRLCRVRKDDPPVYPSQLSYVIESLPDGTLCLMTDHDNDLADIIIQYIRKEDNPARYTSAFSSAFSYRIGAELAFVIAESRPKFETMMSLYDTFLKKAIALNNSSDFLADETGNTDWEDAGR